MAAAATSSSGDSSQVSLLPPTYSYQHRISWAPFIVFLIVGLGCLFSGLFAYDNVYFQAGMYAAAAVSGLIASVCLYRRLVPEETLYNIIVDLMKSTEGNDVKHFQRLWKYVFQTAPRETDSFGHLTYTPMVLTLPTSLQERLFSSPYGNYRINTFSLVHTQTASYRDPNLEREGLRVRYDRTAFNYSLYIWNPKTGEQQVPIGFQWTDNPQRCQLEEGVISPYGGGVYPKTV